MLKAFISGSYAIAQGGDRIPSGNIEERKEAPDLTHAKRGEG
jgi:hypothetical protein